MNTKNLLVGIGLCLLSACTEVDNKLEVNRALAVSYTHLTLPTT